AFQVDEIRLEVPHARVNAITRAMTLPKIRFDCSRLKGLTGSMEVADGMSRVEIQGKETGLARLARDLNLLPSGWTLTGRDTVQAQIRFGKAEGVVVTAQLAFWDMGFQNQEGTFVGEKVGLRARISGETDPSNSAVTADITVDAETGEVLYDQFYVDLKRHSLSFYCTGTYNNRDKNVQFSNLRLGLKDVLTCHVKGRMRRKGPGWQFALSADIPERPVKPVFDIFVKEPFQAQKPILRTLHMGGTASADLNLTGTRSDWRVRGSLQWKDGRVASQDKGVSLDGIDLHLPLWVRNRDADDPLPMLKGRLSIGSVGLPLLPQQALTLPLEAGPNRLSVVSPTVVKIPGGDVRMGPVVISGLGRSTPSITTHLAMEGVEVGPLLTRVFNRPVPGTLIGTLNPVQLEGGRLTSSGEIKARVFDGEVLISDPGASGLLTGTPVFKLDARWKDLNLSKLTEGTSFGKIEGVLDGYAKGLEIAQGQPQKFDLLMETARKDGVEQRISVKAVDNIARIGGGQSPFVGLAGMFASVFKEFPYEKIGVHATLENDVFRIHGTIQEGGTEYLVKRGLFSGVNVVNQNPDNRVSFKDMIKRIKRVTTSKSGPVIK
ncbi:MAG: hypothetical protein JRL30_11330, partial [Deltaproteobacteria bacterium]|nr:hypothetical protein [Deltaproteobacteria bacterium]